MIEYIKDNIKSYELYSFSIFFITVFPKNTTVYIIRIYNKLDYILLLYFVNSLENILSGCQKKPVNYYEFIYMTYIIEQLMYIY